MKKNSFDVKYQKFDSDTEELLDEIFNAEYEFLHWYDNNISPFSAEKS